MASNSFGDLVFTWNESAVRELLNGPHGDVARDLARRAVAVETAAKVNASGRPGPRPQTGRLRASITWTLGSDSEGLFADVGTNVEYGRYLELGTVNMPPYPFLAPALQSAAG